MLQTSQESEVAAEVGAMQAKKAPLYYLRGGEMGGGVSIFAKKGLIFISCAQIMQTDCPKPSEWTTHTVNIML